jgi:hypothetical protein
MQRVLLSVGLALVLAAPSSAQPTPAPVPVPPGVAFDQVDIVTLGPYGGAPTDFQRDAAELEAAAASGKTVHIPLKTLKHFAYFNGKSRVDNVIAHTVVITKPGEIDTLDTEKKTYQRVSESALAAGIPIFPESTAPPSPGSLDLHIGVDTTPLAPMNINGTSSDGFRTAITLSAEGTGSCEMFSHMMNINATLDSYVIDRPEPSMFSGNMLASFGISNLTKLPFFDPKGCAIEGMSYDAHHLVNTIAITKFYVYRRISLAMNAPGAASMSPTIVSERGNVRTLTSADAALFEVPAGYTLVP